MPGFQSSARIPVAVVVTDEPPDFFNPYPGTHAVPGFSQGGASNETLLEYV